MTRRPTLQLLAALAPSILLQPSESAAQSPPGAPPPRAEANDNRLPAGVLRDGVLTIHLVARMAAWYPEAEDGPFKIVETFGEAGKAPRVPGPLLRIPLGTSIDATITNSLPDTLIVFGMRGRSDTLRIAPNAVQRVRHAPSAAGNFLYRAGIVRAGEVLATGTHAQLVGGLIVDAGAAPRDRIFIATGWDSIPYFLAMNGKSWPYTEKFVHTVGDTIHWRVLNAGTGSAAHHPMHLHGFYYRVDARGGWDTDTLYGAAQRRLVVTENLPGLSSMSMTWVPERAGNWLFHCHNSDHIAGRNRHSVAGTPRPYPPLETHDVQEHLEKDMSGLVNAITVLPRPGAVVAESRAVAARNLRLLIQSRARFYGNGPGFGYVLQDGATEPARDSINIPGPVLMLRRDEPVEISLINNLGIHTAVHWHGIELESFYDGVAGWSGAGDKVAPMIAPSDSFVVRFTPPRAGTFIYHAHLTDHIQIGRGLYGALIVTAPDRPRVPDADHIMIVGFGRPKGAAGVLLNGSDAPLPLMRRRDGTHRIRIINIATENNVVVTLSDGGTLLRWKAVAKDGFDLPVGQQRVQPATVRVFMGETYDFEFESAADVLNFRIKNPSVGEGIDDVTQQIRVRR